MEETQALSELKVDEWFCAGGNAGEDSCDPEPIEE